MSIGIPTICWAPFPAKTSSEFLLLESECSLKYANTRYTILKMKVFRIILASLLFSFFWGIVVQRVEKLKDFMLVIWLKFGYLRCSNYSFEFL